MLAPLAEACRLLTAWPIHYSMNVSNMAWLLQMQVVAAVKRVVGSRVAA